jgi:hypothetical protein
MSGESSKPTPLPFPATPAQLYARALWDPKPTTTSLSEKQLAYALGYPDEWRVERRLESRDGKQVTYDRIYATAKNNSKYTWFHHDAAQKAAAQFRTDGTLPESHLLPPLPLYTKGDLIQVSYEGKWYEGMIVKRKKQADEFSYDVLYTADDSTQAGVEEQDIRPGEDPSTLAMELGFSTGWKASRKGARYILTSPTGEKFTTKKAALKWIKEQEQPPEEEDEDVGDPPWRTEGHEFIGRKVEFSATHKASGTRRIKVTQVGTISGYIDSKDVDKQGEPGFVSEATGKPANLFHVDFPDQPHHPYAAHLVSGQDLEESEVLEGLLEENPAKKRKTSSTGRGRRSST